MSITITPTRIGPRNWLMRKLELLNVNATLAWAEGDIHYFSHIDPYPEKVAMLEREVAALRVRQATLRSGT